MKRTSFLLCLLFALCMQVVAAEHSYTQKAVKQTVKVGASTREMLVYVPTDLPEKAPMVISLHGFNQNPDWQMGRPIGTRWQTRLRSWWFILREKIIPGTSQALAMSSLSKPS